MDTSLETLRKKENAQILHHLFEIKAIAKQKSLGSGIDKTIGDLFLQGVGQFHLEDALEELRPIGYRQSKYSFVPPKTERTDETIRKENRDIVRHLIGVRNVVNTKCSRCDANCMGCSFSGREDFNIETGMRIIFLYDWKAILDVVSLTENAYWDDVYAFVNSLADKVGGGIMIHLKDAEFETHYLQSDAR